MIWDVTKTVKFLFNTVKEELGNIAFLILSLKVFVSTYLRYLKEESKTLNKRRTVRGL